ncbi:helix-turn-helix domain-containing protein [Chryseobacterium ginsenosidimutans]|uniref:winged helix-turn-helix transcriptional regulator n=1 Tax=Chryseobacterium ginsenosidimutans TaxID=687846 RepID=UPI0031D04A8F
MKCEKIYSDTEMRLLQDALYVLNGKWKLYIVRAMAEGNNRFSDLKNTLKSITPRMLSKELKELEVNHIITKVVHEEDYPSWTEYRFTDYSKALAPVMDNLITWAASHRQELFPANSLTVDSNHFP